MHEPIMPSWLPEVVLALTPYEPVLTCQLQLRNGSTTQSSLTYLKLVDGGAEAHLEIACPLLRHWSMGVTGFSLLPPRPPTSISTIGGAAVQGVMPEPALLAREVLIGVGDFADALGERAKDGEIGLVGDKCGAHGLS